MENKEIIVKVLSIIPRTKDILNVRNITSEEKTGIGNIVTTTDKRLEEYLKTKLLEMFPESQVISEESAEETKIKNNGDLKFIVDPLDGTTNFINGCPHTVAIGIANNNELVVGVIYDVLAGTVYSAIKRKRCLCLHIDAISDLESVVIIPSYKTENIKKICNKLQYSI